MTRPATAPAPACQRPDLAEMIAVVADVSRAVEIAAEVAAGSRRPHRRAERWAEGLRATREFLERAQRGAA